MLDLLKPKNVHREKIRIGPEEDGGYVMPKLVLEECSALFTYGVGVNWGYESDFNKAYNKPVYMFDHTIGRENWTEGSIHFVNEGLGFSDKCKDVIEHYKEIGVQGDIFLKIDIEGGEYDYFLNTDVSRLSSFVNGISLEVHWLDNVGNRNKFIKMMAKLKPYFTLCHIHGNNWGDLWHFEGLTIPKVFELSFINNRLITEVEEETSVFPIEGLDKPNNPNKPDYKLEFINYKEDPTRIKHYYKGVPSGWFNYEEVYDIAIQRILQNNTATFVELGVWFGQSLCYAGVEVVNSGKNIKIHGVDSFLHGDQPSPDALEDIIRYEEALKYIQPVQEVITLHKISTKEGSNMFEDETIDFLFIDADYTYEGVKADLQNWYPKVKKGGLIGGHDYEQAFPGVIKAVDEFFKKTIIYKAKSSKSWYCIKDSFYE